MFDLADRNTFDHCEMWMKEIDKHNPEAKRMLLGLKSDRATNLDDPALVKIRSDAQSMATNYGIGYAECSSRTGEGVQEAVAAMVRTVANTPGYFDGGTSTWSPGLRQRQQPAPSTTPTTNKEGGQCWAPRCVLS